MEKVTVFCASSNKVAEKYYAATTELGQILAKNNITVYYGGGKDGLMGALSRTLLAEQGRIIGVLPEFMRPFHWYNADATQLIWVKNMFERKQMLLSDTDAVICLPGGCGTLDELLEVITLKQLGQFDKPIVILNTGGYFEPLFAMFRKMTDEHFMREMHLGMWTTVSTPAEILPAIESSPKWELNNASSAQI